MIKVYSKPHCFPCQRTKEALTARNIPYESIELTPEKAQEFFSQGHRQAPIVVTPDATWAGYQPTKINALGSLVGAHG